MNDKCYYDILRVERTATKAEINSAYKKMSLESHPDKGGDDELQQIVNEAKEVLTNEVKRAIYDRMLSENKIRDGKGFNTAKYFDKVLYLHKTYKTEIKSLKENAKQMEDLKKVKDELKLFKEENEKLKKENSELKNNLHHFENLQLEFDGLTTRNQNLKDEFRKL